ncbi:2-C-methyl-D-erythritol 2,4-cyclodiphosphate synthase [Thermaerobacter litoralis]
MTGWDEPAAGPGAVAGGGGAEGVPGPLATEVAALVPAAGRSTRLGGGMNKVFRDLAGRPVLARSLEALWAAGVRRAVVALRPEDRPLWEARVEPRLPAGLDVALVDGGAEREDSVYAALERLAAGPRPPRWVLVHDAARPLAGPGLIRRVLEAARRHGAAVPAVPVGDTIKEVGGRPPAAGAGAGRSPAGDGPAAGDHPAAAGDPVAGGSAGGSDGESTGGRAGSPPAPVEWVVATLPRERLRAVQTPQGFRLDLLLAAHRQARQRGWRGFTDDAALLERLGVPVAVVAGDPANLKLTWPGDFTVAEQWLRQAGETGATGSAGTAGAPLLPFRIGLGYDVHRFVPGRPLVLGGVAIPSERGLEGHSDADVVLHAAMDALLGAAGLPDIGHWFPPGDPRWAGAPSTGLAAHVATLLRQRGWEPAQVDVTVVAETPRLAPHVEAMRQAVAAAFGLPPEAVGIKATTNEGLGFAGRKEGVAALAVGVVVRRPPDAPA